MPKFVANGTQARDFLRVIELVAAGDPPAHHARAALALLGFRERELAAGWPEASADFARDCGARVAAARAALVAAAKRVPERPLVSVVLTTRGDVARLRDALASVALQRYERWEIVLAPIGAPDLEPFLAELPYRDRIVRFRPRLGFSGAAVRNTAAQLAAGEVVAYLDELDLWTPDHLETVVGALRGGEAQSVRTGAELALEWRDPAREHGRTLVHVEPLPQSDPAGTLVSAATPLSTIAVRRELLERVGFEELPFLEDWDFALRAMLAGPVATVPARTVRVGHEAYPLEAFIQQWPLCASIVDAVHRRAARDDADPVTATRRELARAAARRRRARARQPGHRHGRRGGSHPARCGVKAVILAGGLGTRLSEETATRPKPMVEIGGRPILWHIMRHYASYGINDFIVCLGYKGYVDQGVLRQLLAYNADVTIDLATSDVHTHRTSPSPGR